MLIKLLKYEFRSIGRQLIPLYLGVLALALINHLFWFSAPANSGLADTLGGIPAYASMLGYIAVIVALFVITLLLIIQRFYKGLLTEEGYLMFTLPCKPWQLIAAKGITAAVMTAVGTCIGFLSGMLMALKLSDWGEVFRAFGTIPWDQMFKYHAFWPLYILELIVLIVVCLFGSIGHLYVAIALGHLSNKHRVSLAIVAYIGINIAMSAIMMAIGQSIDIFDINHMLNRWFYGMHDAAQVHLLMLLLIVGNLIPAAIYFFGTNWILSRKLNLE